MDDIQLTPSLLTSLFNNKLIVKEIESLNIPEGENDIKFIGNNSKGVLILINNPQEAFLDDKNLAFLTEILKACKLTLADIALVNFSHYPALNGTTLVERFSPDKILLLDVEPAAIDLPLLFPHFQVQKFDRQVYLAAPSLNAISADINLKKQFWESLKKIFNL